MPTVQPNATWRLSFGRFGQRQWTHTGEQWRVIDTHNGIGKVAPALRYKIQRRYAKGGWRDYTRQLALCELLANREQAQAIILRHIAHSV